MTSREEISTIELSKATIAWSIFASWIIYITSIAIHRLYFSQYAKFPGPRLAALTYGYVFYYDVIAGSGEYMYKIEKLHKEYDSPIIRISPHELHVIDPDFYDILFAGAQSKRDKPPTWSHAFGISKSTFGTISHNAHRLRRNAIAPSFSTARIQKLEPLIQENIDRLISVFRRYQKKAEVVSLRAAMGALTSDIISEYCFGFNDNYIEAPGFNVMILEANDTLTGLMHVTVQAQWLPPLLDRLPERLVEAAFGQGLAMYNELKRHCVDRIKATIKFRGEYSDVKHRTIFHDVLDNQALPEADKSGNRLWQEAQLLLSAGTVTTATSVSSAIVYLLLDQERFAILIEELETALPDIKKPLPSAKLEKLPYLSAVVQETLRLVSGVSYRLTRSAPNETLQLGKWSIPPDTAISMHGPLIHHSPTIYPEPWSFIPERWLPSSIRPPGIPLANPKHLVPFSRGSRNCLGQPLAHAEIYMSLATIIRNFARLDRDETGKVKGVTGMRLYETDRRDTDLRHDFGFPIPEKGRGNIRVVFE